MNTLCGQKLEFMNC